MDERNQTLSDVTFGDYLTVLWRRRRLVLISTGVVVALAIAVLALRSPVYEASATVFVQPLTVDPLGGLSSGDRLVDLSTEQEFITSSAVLERAAADVPGVSPEELRRSTIVETTVDEAAQVLRIVTRNDDATRAAELADALASAYLEHRGQRASDALGRALTAAEQRLSVLQSRLDEVVAEIIEIDAEEAEADASLASELANAESRRSILLTQIGAASTGLADIASVQLSPGELLSPASVPDGAAGPPEAMLLLVAAALGALLGVVVAFGRDRTDGRVWDVSQVERILGAPVFARIPTGQGSGRHRNGAVQRNDAIQRLSVGLQAASPADQRGLTVAVTAVDDFPGRERLTYEIVQTLSSDGISVVVIDADASTSSLSELFGTAEHWPGLVDAIHESGNVASFLVPSSPNVSLLPYGKPATEPRQRHGARGLRSMFDDLQRLAEFIVVHVEPVRTSAQSLEMQRWAQASLLVVQEGRTTARDLEQVRREFELTDVDIIGAVLVAREASSDYSTNSLARTKSTETTEAPSAWRPPDTVGQNRRNA